MSELVVPEFELEFYGPTGDPLSRGMPEYQLALRSTARILGKYYESHIKLIEELEVEKPSWFAEAESQARFYWHTLAFDNLAPIILLKEDEGLETLDMLDRENKLARHDSELDVVLAREKTVGILHEKYGVEGVASLAVHELGHATSRRVSNMSVHLTADSQPGGYEYKDGFLTVDKAGEQGLFFEELFAEFFAGHFVRSSRGNVTPGLSFEGVPSRELPPHYQFSIGEDTVRGPDGYAAELLAWGLQKHGISTNDFFITLLETRRPETADQALQEFEQMINRAWPGLFSLLNNLPYSKEKWQNACELIHTIVTKK
jgi:hypothetical protein